MCDHSIRPKWSPEAGGATLLSCQLAFPAEASKNTESVYQIYYWDLLTHQRAPITMVTCISIVPKVRHKRKCQINFVCFCGLRKNAKNTFATKKRWQFLFIPAPLLLARVFDAFPACAVSLPSKKTFSPDSFFLFFIYRFRLSSLEEIEEQKKEDQIEISAFFHRISPLL